MRYKTEKFMQLQRRVAEADMVLSMALKKILLEVLQSDEEIAKEQFARGWSCGYEKGYADGQAVDK